MYKRKHPVCFEYWADRRELLGNMMIALVLDTKWQSLFTEEEVAIARRWLEDCGYYEGPEKGKQRHECDGNLEQEPDALR